MRRERIERIANAERDRRAGRIALAVAAIGEPSEWPARVVLALARLQESVDTDATRHILEEGLDEWVSEVGLDPFDEDWATSPAHYIANPEADNALDTPIEQSELEQAFLYAEAQTDEMHDVNFVASRVLMDEPMGLSELSGDDLTPVEDVMEEGEELLADVFTSDREGYAGAYETIDPPIEHQQMDAAILPDIIPELDESTDSNLSKAIVLSTLTQWLKNLEASRARSAR